LPGKGLAAAVPRTAAAPTAAATPVICYETNCRLLNAKKYKRRCEMICQLLNAKKYDVILEIESKYRHLDTFSDDPVEDVHMLYAFGCAIHQEAKDEACLDRVIHYYKKSKERIDANANCRSKTSKLMKTDMGMHLAGMYSADVTWKRQSLRIDWYLHIATVTKSQRIM